MPRQFDYTGKLCVVSLPFSIYKDVDTIDCLVPHDVNPDDLLFIVACNYHDKIHDHMESISSLGSAREQSFIASGGTDKTTFYLSFGKAYEKSHWIDWGSYKNLV